MIVQQLQIYIAIIVVNMYVRKQFQKYATSRDTLMHKTVRTISALNGVPERMNRTIVNRARACLLESGLRGML